MPSLPTVPRRRQRSEEEDDTDEASSPAPASQSSNTSKRVRLESRMKSEGESDGEDVNVDSTPEEESGSQEVDGGGDDDEDEDVSEPSRQTPTQTQTQTQASADGNDGVYDRQGEVDADSYKPGSIVRIRVNDFVTYTSAEFFPGPKLNMVIGPNGTGKSTLVCAICLGLGWGPQHLGRAKDPGEFVKHGSREASIEIELAGGTRFRRNPVVRRVIKRDGNKSLFFLDDKPTTRNKVYELAQLFAIQIDNLCQFLPQDKVSEFAALTPVELLYSTQRAAAGQEMIEWHDSLKKLRTQQKKLQTDNQNDKDTLANLENRQEMQRPDVERMRQRAQIKRKIEMLEFARPVTRYKDHHIEFEAAKEKMSRLKRELERLEAELEPALRTVTAKEHYCSQLNEALQRQNQRIQQADGTAQRSKKKIDDYEESMKDVNGQIEAEKRSGTSHKQEVNKVHQTINKLRRQLNEEPVEFDVDWYNERTREKRNEMRELEERANQIKSERRPLFETLKDKKLREKQALDQLQNLDSVSGRQETLLQKISPDSFKAYKWLLGNQNMFEKEVFGPPIVTCSMKDPKYADAIESLMQKNDFTSFTVQSREDFRTLQRTLCMGMKLSDITIRTCSASLERFHPSVPDEEIQKFGFDGWAKDFLDGPEPVLAVFCSENRLHQTPIGLCDINDDEYNRIAQGNISSWVSGKHAYQITRRREYGPDAVSTRTRPVKRAQVWTSQPVEASTKRELQQNVDMLRDECREIEDRAEASKARLTQMGKEHDEAQNEKVNLEREKSERQTAHTTYRAIPEKINQQEVKLKSMEELFDGIRARVRGMRDQQCQLSIKRAEAGIEYTHAVEKLRKFVEKNIATRVRQIEALSDVETLKERSSEHRETLKRKDADVKEATAYLRTESVEAKRLLKEANNVVKASRDQPDLTELLHSLGGYNSERLEGDIDSEKAHLELTQGGNSNVIKEFDERERQIQKLRGKLSDFETQLTEYNYAINEVRGKWEPKLEALVKRISDAFGDSFARIGCAGQVTLDKAEDLEQQSSGDSDFDQWSIQIYVKFRESENLSQLNSHRQSGGERAVSTIFYLMALQSLSASPFRVVDEINQGMDPRNERMVHERLVDIACAGSTVNNESVGGSGGGQYFLVTPKLLSGLVYKPGMRVLCIVSGEHMPEDYTRLDFTHAVQRLRAVAEKSGRSKGKRRAIENGSGGVRGVRISA